MTSKAYKKRRESGTIAHILLGYRICVFLFCAMMILISEGFWPRLRWSGMVWTGLGVYQLLTSLTWLQIMRNRTTQLLLCCADVLMGILAVSLTGGIHSPLIACTMTPVFMLHLIYKTKGLFYGLTIYVIGLAGVFISSGGSLPPGGDPVNIALGLIQAGMTVLVLYAAPALGLRSYFHVTRKSKSLEEKNLQLEETNHRILTLFGLVGRFSPDFPMEQIMEKTLVVCKELFKVERVCIFLIQNGEVEIYGKPTPQERENIYRLIVEQTSGRSQSQESHYYYDEGTAMVPLVRGTRLNGVLSLHEREAGPFTKEDALLFTLAANLLCTYLAPSEGKPSPAVKEDAALSRVL